MRTRTLSEMLPTEKDSSVKIERKLHQPRTDLTRRRIRTSKNSSRTLHQIYRNKRI